jgi:hypothetical protein
VVRGASAQDLDRLRLRADSLAIEWRDAQMLADLQDSLRRDAPPPNMERVQAGALTILADPSRLPLQEAADAAWRELTRFYGSRANALRDHPLILRVLSARQTRAPGRGERWVLATDDLELPELTQLLVRNAPFPGTDAALRAWLPALLVPPHDTARERALVYVDLVTSHASISGRCFTGDLAACRIALGLTAVTRPVLDWWTPADRRRLVPILIEEWAIGRTGRDSLANACLEHGSDSACVELLETIPANALPRPLGMAARLSLIHVAVERGGPDAYARLLADSAAPMADRMAAAAGLGSDSLLAVWQRVMAASRPSRVRLPWSAGVVVFGWIAVFAACAIRSTRWRL